MYGGLRVWIVVQRGSIVQSGMMARHEENIGKPRYPQVGLLSNARYASPAEASSSLGNSMGTIAETQM